MMRDQRRQQRMEESLKKKEKRKNERVLQTFKSTVEVFTPPRSSVVPSHSQKSLLQPEPENPPPTHLSATPLSSCYYPATSGLLSGSQHSAAPVSPSNNALCQSEPHSAARGMPTSDLEIKCYSQPNLRRSKAPVHSRCNMAASELEANSSAQSSDIATSSKVMPLGLRNFAHGPHHHLTRSHNTGAFTRQKHRLKVTKKNGYSRDGGE